MAKLTLEENQETLNALKRTLAELQLLHDQISDMESSTAKVDFKKGLLVLERYDEKLEDFRGNASELFTGYQLVDSQDRALDEEDDKEDDEDELGDDEDEDGD